VKAGDKAHLDWIVCGFKYDGDRTDRSLGGHCRRSTAGSDQDNTGDEIESERGQTIELK
jgi:hypothetical protein